jgi:hypothetical protein
MVDLPQGSTITVDLPQGLMVDLPQGLMVDLPQGSTVMVAKPQYMEIIVAKF